MAITLKFDDVDVKGYIKAEGITWGFNIIDGPNAGDKQDGTAIPNKINIKRIIKIKSKNDISLSDASTLLSMISAQEILVEVTDPLAGVDTIFTMRAMSVIGAPCTLDDDKWDGFTFTLMEV
jgi:hypothetical protein